MLRYCLRKKRSERDGELASSLLLLSVKSFFKNVKAKTKRILPPRIVRAKSIVLESCKIINEWKWILHVNCNYFVTDPRSIFIHIFLSPHFTHDLLASQRIWFEFDLLLLMNKICFYCSFSPHFFVHADEALSLESDQLIFAITLKLIPSLCTILSD